MKYIFLIFSSMFISMHSFSQVSKAKFIDKALIIDGNNSDWGGRPASYASQSNILYELRNNNDYLFIILELVDKESQIKFMHAGFEMSITAKTKPKLKASINFIPQLRNAIEMPALEGFQKSNNMQEKYLLNADYVEISGFLETDNIIKRNKDYNQQFTYNIGWAENENMLIEIQVPLSEIYTAENNKYELSDIVLNLNAKLNALERPSGEQMPPNEGGMRSGGPQGGMQGGSRPGGSGGGGRGGRGGGSGGRGQDGPPANAQTMSSAQFFKAKYYLANQK